MGNGSGDSRPHRGPPAALKFTAIPAEADRLPRLRNALADWANDTGLTASQIEAAVLAGYESLANAAVHAYEDSAGVLDMYAHYDPKAEQVEVTVSDYGRWRPPSQEHDELGGRGLVLIRNLADHAEVTTGPYGTTVRMTWTVPRVLTPDLEPS